MRPIARLATELRITGIGQLLAGGGGLAGALARDLEVGRGVIPFVVAFLLIGGVSLYGSRWILQSPTPEASPEARVESTALTFRRVLVSLSVPVLAIALGIAFGRGLAAVLGGVVAAVGAVDLRNLALVRARERGTGALIYRELGPSPFSGGRRPLYTRPT